VMAAKMGVKKVKSAVGMAGNPEVVEPLMVVVAIARMRKRKRKRRVKRRFKMTNTREAIVATKCPWTVQAHR